MRREWSIAHTGRPGSWAGAEVTGWILPVEPARDPALARGRERWKGTFQREQSSPRPTVMVCRWIFQDGERLLANTNPVTRRPAKTRLAMVEMKPKAMWGQVCRHSLSIVPSEGGEQDGHRDPSEGSGASLETGPTEWETLEETPDIAERNTYTKQQYYQYRTRRGMHPGPALNLCPCTDLIDGDWMREAYRQLTRKDGATGIRRRDGQLEATCKGPYPRRTFDKPSGSLDQVGQLIIIVAAGAYRH